MKKLLCCDTAAILNTITESSPGALELDYTTGVKKAYTASEGNMIFIGNFYLYCEKEVKDDVFSWSV
jgi:uroporphyrinogen-III decarboxylase